MKTPNVEINKALTEVELHGFGEVNVKIENGKVVMVTTVKKTKTI